MTHFFYLLLFVVSIFVTILFVIGTHEFAHFAVARLLGVKVLRFSIGFGKTLWRRYDKSGTEYVFALIPLGGYVKMLDESEGAVAPQERHRAFNRQPFFKKFLIVLAGPTMNLLCAFTLYWLIFVVGFVAVKPVIGQVTPHSIASKAGVQANQEIISVDLQNVTSWTGVLFRLLSHIGSNDSLMLGTRDAKNVTTYYSLDLMDWKMNNLTPDPLSSLGIIPYEPPLPLVIGHIADGSPAALSPLKVGDRIVALNGQRIHNWQEIMRLIQSSADKDIVFTVKRAKQTLRLSVKVGAERSVLLKKSGFLGIGPSVVMPPEMLREVRYTPLAAIPKALHEVSDFVYFNLVLFGKLVTGKLSLQTLGGPITIFESAGESLNSGIIPFLGFLAFLSASVGVINLFPIPGLDGGHLLFELIEVTIRRPLPQTLLFGLYYLGFAFLIFVLTQALFNDILRLV